MTKTITSNGNSKSSLIPSLLASLGLDALEWVPSAPCSATYIYIYIARMTTSIFPLLLESLGLDTMKWVPSASCSATYIYIYITRMITSIFTLLLAFLGCRMTDRLTDRVNCFQRYFQSSILNINREIDVSPILLL